MTVFLQKGDALVTNISQSLPHIMAGIKKT